MSDLDNLLKQNVFKYSALKVSALKNLLLAFVGALIGFVNGIFGSGGGMLAVPALTLIAGLDEKRAHATAIVLILPLCLVSVVVYSLRGGFDLFVVLPTLFGVLAGGVAGAALMKKLSSGLLSALFYGIMLFAGIKMIIA